MNGIGREHTWHSSCTAQGTSVSPVTEMRTTTVSAFPSSRGFCEPAQTLTCLSTRMGCFAVTVHLMAPSQPLVTPGSLPDTAAVEKTARGLPSNQVSTLHRHRNGPAGAALAERHFNLGLSV